MKLFATVASERATKGQGGNFLNIDVFNEDKLKIVEGEIKIENGKLHVYFSTTIGEDDQCIEGSWNIEKGEKKKDEICRFCKSKRKLITDNEGDKYCAEKSCEMYQ